MPLEALSSLNRTRRPVSTGIEEMRKGNVKSEDERRSIKKSQSGGTSESEASTSPSLQKQRMKQGKSPRGKSPRGKSPRDSPHQHRKQILPPDEDAYKSAKDISRMLDRKATRKSAVPATAADRRASQDQRDQFLAYNVRKQAPKKPQPVAKSLSQAISEIGGSIKDICKGLPIDPFPGPPGERDKSVPHAPNRARLLEPEEEELVVLDALKYFPVGKHDVLKPEFREELETYGHIYMYRFRPKIKMQAYSLAHYPVKCQQAAAAMHMIMANLDPKVAMFPHELITYDGDGQVFSNWAQFWISMHYLSIMTEDQTLVIYSGHPMGLFPTSPHAPRVAVTSGCLKIPNYTVREENQRQFAMGVAMSGPIGFQTYVHGAMVVIRNAARKYLKTDNLAGKVYLSSGLGKMGSSQAIAVLMNEMIGVIAEVNRDVIEKCYEQGWLTEVTSNLDDLCDRVRLAKEAKKTTCIGFEGNVVDVWERFAEEWNEKEELLVDLATDQTALDNPIRGGYYPVQISVEKANKMIDKDTEQFTILVQKSIQRQVRAINSLAFGGMIFWDYGNGFLLEAERSGADIIKRGPRPVFKYPYYDESILRMIFSMGFAPLRWVCTSGSPSDLSECDRIIEQIFPKIIKENTEEQSEGGRSGKPPIVPLAVNDHYRDNLRWIRGVKMFPLVVGPQARIIYADEKGRLEIALAFNNAIKESAVKCTIILCQDHTDFAATDSPMRNLPNMYNSFPFRQDIAVQTCIGDSFRGATWISVHESVPGLSGQISGGFGIVLDGSEEAERKARSILSWDVANGVARRAWHGDPYSRLTIRRSMKANHELKITFPHMQQSELKAFQEALKNRSTES